MPHSVEDQLARLGIHRIPMPIPYREAGGPVNAYAIEEDGGGVLLFDAGMGWPEAEVALERGLAAAGLSFADVRRIVISHGHIDHYGAARTVLEKAGHDVPVYAHELDIPKIAEGGGQQWHERMAQYASFLVRLGVPPDAMGVLASEAKRGRSLARPVPRVLPLSVSEPLRLRHVVLEPMHMPGHTPGLVCLYDREHRLLFSTDHLLERTSPNPLLELGPNGEEGFFRPLASYVDSIRRARELEVDLVLPGHSVPFTDPRTIIDALLGFYDKRQDKLAGLLAGRSPSAFELARALFPRAKPTQLLLTISETVGNLEVMEDRGRVVRSLEGGIYRFELAA